MREAQAVRSFSATFELLFIILSKANCLAYLGHNHDEMWGRIVKVQNLDIVKRRVLPLMSMKLTASE